MRHSDQIPGDLVPVLLRCFAWIALSFTVLPVAMLAATTFPGVTIEVALAWLGYSGGGLFVAVLLFALAGISENIAAIRRRVESLPESAQ